MLCGQIYRLLSRKFEILGIIIAKDIVWFLIIPVFVTALLATGFQKLKFDFTDKLYIPYGSDTDKYKSELKELFPDNFVDFDPNRLLESRSYASVIITTKDEKSILKQKIFSEILQIDQKIRNITVYGDDSVWNYQELCAKNAGKCFQNEILSISKKIADVENGTFLLKYPSEKNKNSVINTLSLGGIDVDKDGNIISARALRLFYFLDNRSERKEVITKKWEEAFIETMGEIKFSNVKIERDAFVSKEQLKKQNILVGIKYISPSSIFIFIFTIITCLSPDFLRSKPWTGIISITTTGMSVISGFGILLYIGIHMSTITIIVPFLILGIGMDDTFIMLSAWKKTDTKKCVEKRIGETLSECGVSITLTSVTNIASFTIGALLTSLPVHRVFCIYMSTCLAFDYIYQMTFIVAVLILCGKAEERKLNSLVFLPLDLSVESKKRSCVGRWFFSVPKDEISSNLSLEKFWKALAEKMLNNKNIIIICYLIYLAIAIWGLTYLSFRATFNLGLLYNSYQYFYFKSYENNFYQYQYRLQLFIKEEINYADPQVQQNIEEMMQSFESDPLISGSVFTESWLRSYLGFLANKKNAPILQNFNLTDPNDFYLILRKIFFRIPLAKRFSQDVTFDQNYTKIIASRFLFQTNLTRNGNDFYNKLNNFKKTIEKARYFVILYHFLFYYFDVLDVIPVTVIQTLSTISVVVFLISAVLLPNFISIICVLFTILSVGLGVMGYMSLWDVKLGIMSISMLVMVCGLSVDYAAHVSCAYISSKETVPRKRIINAISLTGMPIFQGSATTVLVVIIFVTRPSLEFFISMKIIFLACTISAMHGIVFVPIIMYSLDHVWKKFSPKKYFGNYNLRNEKARNFTFYNIPVSDSVIS